MSHRNIAIATIALIALFVGLAPAQADTGYSNVFTVDLRTGSPPTASFGWSPSSPNVGDSVRFTDTSTGSPTSWSWNFGDGGTSTSRNPSHTYNSAGTYTVRLTVTNQYGSDSVSQAVTVSAGEGTPDLSIYKIEVSQAAQTVNWDIDHPVPEDFQNPMYTDRKTLVRVFVKSDLPPPLGWVSGQLEVDGKIVQPAKSAAMGPSKYLPSTLKREIGDNNFNKLIFVLDKNTPGRTGTYSLKVTIIPQGAMQDRDTSNNSETVSVEWRQPPGPSIKVGIVEVDFDGDAPGSYSPSDWEGMCQWVRYALPGFQVQCVAPALRTPLSVDTSLWGLLCDADARVGALKRQYVASGTLGQYDVVVGVSATAGSCFFKGIGGMAEMSSGCPSGDTENCVPDETCPGTDGKVAWIFWPSLNTRAGEESLVHELLHTRGLVHNGCAPNSPLVNPEDVQNSLLYRGHQSSLQNIMSYLYGTSGLSQRAYSYLTGVRALASAKNTEQTAQQAWIVSGSVVNGDWEIAKIFKSEGLAAEGDGTYTLVAQDNGGGVLSETSFELAGTPGGSGNEVMFFAAAPYDTRVRSFSIRENGVEVARANRSSHAPSVQIASPVSGTGLNGEFQITWTASDPDGDALTFDVSYSTDGGATWQPVVAGTDEYSVQFSTDRLAGSSSAAFRVRASDGFNTANAEISGLTVPMHNPEVEITSPADGGTYAPGLLLAQAAYLDPDRVGDQPSSVSWYLDGTVLPSHDLRMELGNLAAGGHSLKITAKSPQGRSGTDTVQFVVVNPSEDRLGSGSSKNIYLIPASAHAPGFGGTSWVSDLVVFNQGSSTASVNLYYLQGNHDHSGVTGQRISVPAGASVKLGDVVEDTFGSGSTSGALYVGSDQPLLITSRTYNDAPSGTYGQFIAGMPLGEAIGANETVRLIQLTRNGDYRTNIGFANASDKKITVKVKLYRSNGASIATRSYTVQPYGFYQKTDPIGTDVSDAYAVVSSSTSGAKFFTYASVIDQRTGDPVFVTPGAGTASAGQSLYIPGSAHATGAGGTQWRTDVEIHNPGSTTASYRMELLKRDHENPSPQSRTYNLSPGHSVRYTDALSSIFGFTGAAALRITPSSGTITVTSRTYNQTSKGTYGQFIAAVPASAAIGYGESVPLIQLSDSASTSSGYRTNIGFVNTSNKTITAKADLYDASGSKLGTKTVSLRAYEYKQVDKIFRSVTSQTLDNCYAILSTSTSGGSFLAYGSVVDNRSGDPVYVPATASGGGGGVGPGGEIVLSHRANAILVDQLPEAAGTGSLPSGEYTARVSGSGNLGRADLPIHVVCLYKDPSGNLRAASIGIGETLSGIGGGYPFWCFIPDWVNAADNTGSVEVKLAGGSSRTFRLDAKTNAVLIDELPEAVAVHQPEPGYTIASTGDLGRQELIPHTLAIYKRASDSVLDVRTLKAGDALSDIRTTSDLYLVVMDWMNLSDNTGETRLTPGGGGGGTCTIHVTSPNGGESWDMGSTHTVRWTKSGTGCGSTIKAELLRNGQLASTIRTSTPNDGSLTWDIPTNLAQSGKYRVRLTDLGGTGASDTSDGNFTLMGGGGGANEITVTLPGGVTMELVHIPAGTFMMGSPSNERAREFDEDLHQVKLTHGYYIGKYEVTQAQWQAVMGSNPSYFPSCGGDCPVEQVSWNDICGGSTGSSCTSSSFIGKLNAYLGTTKFRLPTEAEWERVARAGTQTAFSFDTSGNPNWDLECGAFPEASSHMWWCGNSSDRTHRVGSKQPNGYGLYDMHGNVWEWVADWYTSHLGTSAVTDPTGPTSGSSRVKRGGSWGNDARSCRSANRGINTPSSTRSYIGFRLARSE